MRKLLLSLSLVSGLFAGTAFGETINLQGTDYEVETLLQRELGAGVIYKRLRVPEYPLNVNLLIMDMKNPYARIETTQGSETLGKTESLAKASDRQTTPGHKVLGGTNGNFWCVANQNPWSSLLIGATFNANLRNGVPITETNMYSDQWDHGWWHTGIIGIDTDNKAYVGHFAFYATVTNDKIGSPEIIQINKVCRINEIALYNKFYGTDKKFQPVDQVNNIFQPVDGQSTEVLCTIDPGQTEICGENIIATVTEVRKDAGRGTLGNNDFALVAYGGQKENLAKLEAGDKITLRYCWSTEVKGAGTAPRFENIIGGNAMVMIGGELTTANDTETYNSQVYSRTGYGTNATGDKVVAIVIDKSSDPVYGNSVGCNTKIMCDILKYYGCTEAVNMDAGGSAQMVIEGSIINRTTEGNPRSVANGMLMYSTAPEDNTVARLEFDSYRLEAPIYSTFEPVILAYNRYGDIIDHNFRDFTLSCEEKLGKCDGTSFTAAGEAYTGLLTATYNGISVSKEMTVIQAQPAIRIKPLLIDATRKYTIEVTATVNNKLYTYNAADLDWTIEDPSVVSIENGVLTGIKNGTTRITGSIGDFSDNTEVIVEIAPAPTIPLTDFSGWKATGTSGITKPSISADGLIGFTYGSPRSPYIKLAGEHTFYSLPDRLVLSFTPSVDVEKILPTINLKDGTTNLGKTILPEGKSSFEAGVLHTVEIGVDADLTDLANFPIKIKGFTIYPTKNSAWKGDQTIRINDLYAEYKNFSGVESVTVGGTEGNVSVSVSPTAVNAGATINISSDTEISGISIFNISGSEVYAAKANSTLATVTAPQNNGVYLVRVTTAAGTKVVKISVR